MTAAFSFGATLVQFTLARPGNTWATFQLAISPPVDCLKPYTLPFVSGNSECASYPSSVTVSPA